MASAFTARDNQQQLSTFNVARFHRRFIRVSSSGKFRSESSIDSNKSLNSFFPVNAPSLLHAPQQIALELLCYVSPTTTSSSQTTNDSFFRSQLKKGTTIEIRTHKTTREINFPVANKFSTR